MVSKLNKPEQRTEDRRALNYNCWIVTSPSARVPAYLSNISLGGALLLAQEPNDVPNEFVLHLTEDGQVFRRCRVAWRGNGELGVSFEKAKEPPKKRYLV